MCWLGDWDGLMSVTEACFIIGYRGENNVSLRSKGFHHRMANFWRHWINSLVGFQSMFTEDSCAEVLDSVCYHDYRTVIG